jgi:hypothetical protein
MEEDFYKERLAQKFGLSVLIPPDQKRGMINDVIFRSWIRQESMPFGRWIVRWIEVSEMQYLKAIQIYNVRKALPSPRKTALRVIDMQRYFESVAQGILMNVLGLLTVCGGKGRPAILEGRLARMVAAPIRLHGRRAALS